MHPTPEQPSQGTVKPSELSAYFAERIAAAKRGDARRVRPILIRGSPGIGKTRILYDAAAEASIPIEAMDLLVRDPVDLGGLPAVHNGSAKWLPPDWSVRAQEHEHGIAFFDDLGAAAPAVQAAALRLIHEGQCGAARLPKGWLRVAAMNRASDKTVHYRMPSALANRFTWLTLEVDVDDWVAWALRNGVHSSVVAFVRAMRGRVLCTEPVNDGPFATPRTWEYLSDYLLTCPEPLAEAVIGTVGEGAGLEFLAFLDVMDGLPSAEEALDGKHPDFPTRLDQAHALCASVASLYASGPQRWAEAVMEFAHRIPAEFSVVLIGDCLRAYRAGNGPNPLTQAKGFGEWTAKYKDVVL